MTLSSPGCEIMVAQNRDIEDVIREVSAWPAELRLSLAHRLLDGLGSGPKSGLRRGYSAREAAALVNSRQPAPDDTTVHRWIDEHRVEKHSR